MSAGLYEHLARGWRKPTEAAKLMVKGRKMQWRREETVTRVEKPTRTDRARSVGYKAKLGYIVARVKIGKGGRRREYYGRRGRKPSKMGLVHFTHGKSLQKISEEKAQRKFINANVLGSYLVGEDGKHKWFEVVLVDSAHPNIVRNPATKWASTPANAKRALRTR